MHHFINIFSHHDKLLSALALCTKPTRSSHATALTMHPQVGWPDGKRRVAAVAKAFENTFSLTGSAAGAATADDQQAQGEHAEKEQGDGEGKQEAAEDGSGLSSLRESPLLQDAKFILRRTKELAALLR